MLKSPSLASASIPSLEAIGGPTSADCYFDRSARSSPQIDDRSLRMIAKNRFVHTHFATTLHHDLTCVLANYSHKNNLAYGCDRSYGNRLADYSSSIGDVHADAVAALTSFLAGEGPRTGHVHKSGMSLNRYCRDAVLTLSAEASRVAWRDAIHAALAIARSTNTITPTLNPRPTLPARLLGSAPPYRRG